MTTRKTWYSVAIDGQATDAPEMSEALDALIHALEAACDVTGMEGPVAAWGGLAGGPNMTVSVHAADPRVAVDLAIETFNLALKKAGFRNNGIAKIELMTEEFQEDWLAQPPETYLGVSEVAELLGVSRQRVSELRASETLPVPIAELAAGPVWPLTRLTRFIDSWERKPGRPRKTG